MIFFGKIKKKIRRVVMGNLIVKDNALVQASHKLNEVEQRLILLAILKIREKFDNVEQAQNQEITIHADDYMQLFDVERNAAYKALKQAVLGLYRAEWGYQRLNKRGNLEVVYERFTQNAKYITAEATVKFMFSTAIIPLLVELEKNFTSYEIEQVANLSSRYSMRLFELLMQYYDKKIKKGWLEISYADLRFRFGLLENEYELMSNFKKFVLDRSVKQINENTDFKISYEQKKQGRQIVGFRFEIKAKNKEKAQKNTERDLNTIDMFDNLTDIERKIVDQKNAYADSINATEQHRQNLINKALLEHRESKKAKADAKAKAKADKQAKATAEQADLLIAGQVYADLLQADDEVVKDFTTANHHLFSTASAEKHYHDKSEYRLCLQAMKFRFERLQEFKRLDLSMI